MVNRRPNDVSAFGGMVGWVVHQHSNDFPPLCQNNINVLDAACRVAGHEESPDFVKISENELLASFWSDAWTVQNHIFTVMGDLIRVDFAPGYFPVDNDILSIFFPEREIYLTEDRERWLGVVCSMQEWEEFMRFAEHAVKTDSNLTGNEDALSIIQYLDLAYQSFQCEMVTGSFKTPMQWNRLVA